MTLDRHQPPRPSPPAAAPAPAATPGPALPRWFWPLFLTGVAVQLLPLLVAPYLPFNDLHGAAGILGALERRGDPAARIPDYFAIDIHRGPNSLYWAVGWLFSRVMSIHAATNLYIALFCVVLLPVSSFVALRALDRDPTLALLSLPMIYHRCLWYGFVGGVPAVALLLLVLGFANRAFGRPRVSGWDVALAAALLLLSTAHAFLYLVTVGLFLLWALLAIGQPSPLWRRLLPLVPSLLYLGPWLGHTFAPGRTGGGGIGALARHLWTQRPPLGIYLRNLHEWFINGYAGAVDEVLAGLFAITLLGLLVFGLRGEASPRDPLVAPSPTRPWRSRLPLTAGLLIAGYFLLPMTIQKPFFWWAVHVRLLVPALLVLIFLVPYRRRGLPRSILIPAAVGASLYGLYLTFDFRNHFMRVEMAGFAEALQAIPPGQRVHAMYPSFEEEGHYSHFPMGFVVAYYIVERGGTVTPMMSNHPRELWAAWRHQGAQNGWGMARTFRWRAHSGRWDYFLVKQPAPGNGAPYVPFPDAPRGAIDKVFERGLWSVWRRRWELRR